jgi:hypothetical protein
LRERSRDGIVGSFVVTDDDDADSFERRGNLVRE